MDSGVRTSVVRRSGVLVAGAALFATMAGLGCETSTMDRDLKRSADRATITLDRTKTELEAVKADNDRLRKELVAAKMAANPTAGASSGSAVDAAKLKELQDRVDLLDGQLRQARQTVRDMQEAALAARQGMPATRSVTP